MRITAHGLSKASQDAWCRQGQCRGGLASAHDSLFGAALTSLGMNFREFGLFGSWTVTCVSHTDSGSPSKESRTGQPAPQAGVVSSKPRLLGRSTQSPEQPRGYGRCLTLLARADATCPALRALEVTGAAVFSLP